MVLKWAHHCLRVISVRFFARRVAQVVMEDPKVYLSWESESTKFDVKVNFSLPQLNYSKEFNFNRKLDESVGILLDKMKHNIEKDVQKVMTRKKKKIKETPPAVVETLDVDVSVLLSTIDGSSVCQKAICRDVFFGENSTSNLRFQFCGLDYRVVINSPTVVKLSLPDFAMVGFPILPLKVCIKFGSIDQSKFRWYKRSVDSNKSDDGRPSAWEAVGNDEFSFIPSPNEVNYRLKLTCTPGNSSTTGVDACAILTSPIQAGPGLCPFETRQAFTPNRLGVDNFRVVSYNILADRYALTQAANNELYPYCPQYARVWDYRRQLIFKELQGYKADIICLQEVDTKVCGKTACDLHFILQREGFDGHHSEKSASGGEGIATYFRKDKFRFVDCLTCPLGAGVEKDALFAPIWDVIKDNKNLIERLKSVTTLAQVLVLESLEKEKEMLVVSNTHLYFHPDADHVRLLQGGLMFLYLEHVVQVVKSKNPSSRVSLISCGDFNSVPECGIYRLATTNSVPSDFADWKSNAREEIVGLSLSQPFQMSSACGTPDYTNFTVGFAACLDYIYYQTSSLKVVQVVPFPSLEELKAHVALPSVVAPSDHIAVVADLTWI